VKRYGTLEMSTSLAIVSWTPGLSPPKRVLQVSSVDISSISGLKYGGEDSSTAEIPAHWSDDSPNQQPL
jgi:hypothetical protein